MNDVSKLLLFNLLVVSEILSHMRRKGNPRNVATLEVGEGFYYLGYFKVEEHIFKFVSL